MTCITEPKRSTKVIKNATKVFVLYTFEGTFEGTKVGNKVRRYLRSKVRTKVRMKVFWISIRLEHFYADNL